MTVEQRDPFRGTLAGTLLKHAAERPDARAVTTDGSSVTYAELAGGLRRLAPAHDEAPEVQRGDRVGGAGPLRAPRTSSSPTPHRSPASPSSG